MKNFLSLLLCFPVVSIGLISYEADEIINLDVHARQLQNDWLLLTPMSCKDGFVLNGDRCVAQLTEMSCASDSKIWDANLFRCVPLFTPLACAPGFFSEPKTGLCRPVLIQVTCSSDSRLINGVCVKQPTPIQFVPSASNSTTLIEMPLCHVFNQVFSGSTSCSGQAVVRSYSSYSCDFVRTGLYQRGGCTSATRGGLNYYSSSSCSSTTFLYNIRVPKTNACYSFSGASSSSTSYWVNGAPKCLPSLNLQPNADNSGCVCQTGYSPAQSGEGCTAFSCGTNEERSSTTSSCVCIRGYYKPANGTFCITAPKTIVVSSPYGGVFYSNVTNSVPPIPFAVIKEGEEFAANFDVYLLESTTRFSAKAGDIVNVSISLQPVSTSSFNPSSFIVSPRILSFSPSNPTTQTVSVRSPANFFVGDISTAILVVSVQGASSSVASWLTATNGAVVFSTSDATPANVFIPSVDDKGRPSILPPVFTITDGGANSTALIPVSLTAVPPAGVTVTLRVSTSSLTVKSDKTTLFFNQANWNITQLVTVSADLTFATIAVGGPVTITFATPTDYSGPRFKSAIANVNLIRASSLAPRIMTPQRVTKGGSVNVLVSLNNAPVSSVNATISIDVTKAPINGPNIRLEMGEMPVKFLIFDSNNARRNTSIALFYPSNPFATFGEFVRVCISMLGLQSCSSPIMLIDTVKPEISPIQFRNLFSGAWDTFLPDGVTLRIREGSSTLVNFSIATQIAGRLSASLSISSGFEFAMVGTSQSFATSTSNTVALSITGRVQSIPVDQSFTNRTGNFTITIQPDTRSSTLLQDSGYANPPLRRVVQFVLINPGAATLTEKPIIKVEGPVGASFVEGDPIGLRINVSIAPAPTFGTQVVLKVAAPSLTTASSYELVFNANTTKVSLTLKGLEDLIAFDSNTMKTFTFSVSDKTDSLEHLQMSDVSYSATMIDNDFPSLNVSNTVHVITEGGSDSTFLLSLTASPPEKQFVTVVLTNATGACLPSTSSLLSLRLPCTKSSDCPTNAPICQAASSRMFSLVSAFPQTVIFSSEDWSLPRTITLRAPRDGLATGKDKNSFVRINVATSTTLTSFQVVKPVVVSASITDVDVPGGSFIEPSSTMFVEGSSSNVESKISGVKLNTLPLAPVSISVSSSDPSFEIYTGFTNTPGSLFYYFSSGVKDDLVLKGNASNGYKYYVPLEFKLLSMDPAYNNTIIKGMRTIIDDERAGVDVSIPNGAVLEEGGGASFVPCSIKLKTRPLSDVTVTVTESTSTATFSNIDDTCANLPTTGSQLETQTDGNIFKFTVKASDADWSVPRFFRLSARADARKDSNQTVGIQTIVSSSDPNYNNLRVSSSSVQILENNMVDPPQIVDVSFDSSYDSLTMTFNKNIVSSNGTQFNCANLFQVLPASAPTSIACKTLKDLQPEVRETNKFLGEGSYCTQTSSTAVKIVLGSLSRPSIVAGNFVSLNYGVIRATRSAIRSTYGSVIVKDSPVKPAPVVSFSSSEDKLDSCSFRLIGPSISGTGGRPFTIVWSARGANSALNSEIALLNSKGLSSLFIDVNRLPTGTSVNITVTVTNWLNIKSSASMLVTRETAAKPKVELAESATYKRSESFSVSIASATLSSCTAVTETSGLEFYWFDFTASTPIGSSSLYTGTATTALQALPFFANATASGKYLKFGNNVRSASFLSSLALPAGKYTIGVYTVSRADRSFTFKTQQVTITNDELVASIEGGIAVAVDLGASTSSSNSITFVATGSGEPTETLRLSQSGLTFTWTTDCAVSSSCQLVSSESTSSLVNAVFSISSTITQFTVTLTVSGAGRTSATASQTVKYSSTPIPKVSIICSTSSAGSVLPAFDNIFAAEASVDSFTKFSYVWYAGSNSAVFPDSVTRSTSDLVTINPREDLSEGSSYNLCVSATAVLNPLVTSYSCFPFLTASAPSVGPVTIVLQNTATTGNTYSISTETLGAVVSSTAFSYLSTDLSLQYNESAYAAGFSSAAAFIKSIGIEQARMTTLASYDSAVPSYSTTKIASGYHIVCIFGYNSAGSYDSSCASVTVPDITLTTDEQKDSINSAIKGGDSQNIISIIDWIIGNDQSKSTSTTTGGRRLQSQSLDVLNPVSTDSSLTNEAVDTVLSTLVSVYYSDIDVASGGQGDNLASILTSLRSNVPALLSLGNATLSTKCYSLAKLTISSMNTLKANLITSGVFENAAFVLCACGSQLTCTNDVTSALASGSISQSFFTSATYTSGFAKPFFYITGSSGVGSSRSPLSLLLNSVGVSASNVDRATANANGYTSPSLVAIYGSGIVGPSGAIAGTTPVEIRALGHAARTSTDKSPVIAVTVSGVIVPAGKSVFAAYTNGATQTASYSNAAASCSGTTCTIYSRSTSTYALVAEDPCTVVVSASDEYSGAATASESVTEGVQKTVYVYLSRQPEATVTVSISLRGGICYTTETNAMITSSGYAVTCSVSSDCSSNQDCRTQIASLTTDASMTPSSSVTLTFTSSNYAASQSLYINPVADKVFENEALVRSSLVLTPTSTDSRYDAVGVCTDDACSSSVGNAGSSVLINVVDVDTASLILSSLSASSRTEGQTATFTVKLSSKPKASVSVSVTEASSAVSFDVNTLTFTTDNWNSAQIVSVTAIDDNLVNGARSVSILSSSSSSDDFFNGKTSSLSLLINDNDVARVLFSTFSPANIDQSGDNAKTSTTITLGALPTEDVVVTISYTSTYATLLTASGSGVSGTRYVSPVNVTISPADWNTGVTVSLNSESDGSENPNAVVTVSMVTSSVQSAFSGLTPSTTGTFTVINSNGGSVVPAMSSFSISEAISGGSSYTVSLSKATTAAVVTVSIYAEVPSSSFPYSSPFLISPSTLTWNLNDMSAQTVTVTPVDDNIAIPPGYFFYIVHNVTSGPSAFVKNGAIKEIVTWVDNDTPSIVISPTAFTITEGVDDSAASFLLSLGTQPATSVSITCSSPFAGAVLNKTTFVFSTVNWNIEQRVWVLHNGTVFHDMDGQHLVTITAAVSAGDYAAPSLSVSSVSTVVTLPNPTPSPTPSVTPTPLPWNVSCQTGFYYSQSKRSCTSCPAGKTSSPGDLECSTCPAGTSSNPAGGVTRCTNCEAGTYSTAGASSCTACSAGYYSAAGATVCTQCAACSGSQYQTSACTLSTNTVCKDCATCTGSKYYGTQCSASADAICSTCKTCAATEYKVSSCSGSTDTVCRSCSTCSSSQYRTSLCSATADTVCSSCTVCNSTTHVETTPCSASSDTVCTLKDPSVVYITCESGSYYNSVTNACSFCPDGKTSVKGSTGSSSCSSCLAGTYSSPQTGVVTCTNCPVGKYSSSDGSASCSSCLSGTYSSAAGATSCTNCAAGTFSSTDGSATCTSCPAGTFASGTGSKSCTNCAAGTYSSSSATSCSTCTSCTLGSTYSSTVCTTTADTVCSKCTAACSAGQYQSSTCSRSSDAVCKTCSKCSDSQVVKTACSDKADTVCEAKTVVAVSPVPSANPPSSTDPVVQIIMNFNNVPASSFNTASGVSSIEASIAKAAGVPASSVKISRVYDVIAKAVIFSARRLQALTTVEITTAVTVESVSKASELGTKLKDSSTAFTANVISDLKVKNPSSFQSATATTTIFAPLTSSSSSSSSEGISGGAVAGIIIGVLIVIGGVGAYFYAKKKESSSNFSSADPSLAAVFDNKSKSKNNNDTDFKFQMPSNFPKPVNGERTMPSSISSSASSSSSTSTSGPSTIKLPPPSLPPPSLPPPSLPPPSLPPPAMLPPPPPRITVTADGAEQKKTIKKAEFDAVPTKGDADHGMKATEDDSHDEL